MSKKVLLFLTFLSLLLIAIFVYKPIKNFFIKKPKQEVWLNIFVHGSFHSILGFLDTYKVIKDEVEGTSYKKVISQMRKDNYFYKSQPMLERGLVKLDPSIDPYLIHGQKFAAYPIIKSYKKILNQVDNTSQNYFYTFGWSGLISQKRRQKESIRFYNALNEELEKYLKKGIKPKIRILTHSHGGNLALNLACVRSAIELFDADKNLTTIEIDPNQKESALKINSLIASLPEKEIAKKNTGQKTFDYKPKNIGLEIDELLMFGTPIQPETEIFAYDKLFKHVFNFYSEQDIVQKIDWVSSKRLYSDQRMNKETKDTQVTQARIMVGHEIPNKKQLLANNAQNDDSEGFWKKLFFGTTKKDQDPDHRELWFISWDKIEKDNKTSISFLPLAIFSPLFVYAIQNSDSKELYDVDIKINITDKKMNIRIYKHNQTKIKSKISIPIEIINEIKNELIDWKPKEVTRSKEFDIINKYISHL